MLLLNMLPGMSVASGELDYARDVIGILPLPEVFGNGACDRYISQDIDLFRSPQSSEKMGLIFVAKPWTFIPSGGCEGLEVAVSIYSPVKRVEKLPTLEFSYEQLGAIVVEHEGKWFKIALEHDFVWVHIQDDGRYLPINQIFKDSLTYLRWQNQQSLLETPDMDKVLWQPDPHMQRDLPVDVLDFREIAGQKTWVKVKLLDVEPCSEEKTHVPPVTGWLPLYDKDGMPVVWFYSRGC